MKIYLSGEIDKNNLTECTKWRNDLKSLFTHIQFYDPSIRVYGVNCFHPQNLVDIDKKEIRDSDIVVVYIKNISVGTIMETLYAYEQGKMVYVVWDRPLLLIQDKVYDHPWIMCHSHKIFYSMESLIEEISSLETMTIHFGNKLDIK